MYLELDMPLVRSSLANGLAVARTAWKRLWVLMALVISVNALMWLIDIKTWYWVQTPIAFLMGLTLNGALFRIADPDSPVDHSGLGPFGLQWGGIEGRLFWAALGKWAFVAFLAFLAFFFIVVLAAIIAFGRGHELNLASPAAFDEELGLWGTLVVAFATLIASAWLIGLSLRLYLCGAASAYSAAPQVLATLHLTDRKTLPLFVISSAVWIPSLAIGFVGMNFKIESLGAGPRMVFDLATSVLSTLVLVPLDIGIQAALYRSLKAGHNPTEYPLESGKKD